MDDYIKNRNLKKIQKDTNSIKVLKDENLALKEDNEYLHKINEYFTGQVNTLTVEAEISRLEFIQVFDAVSDPLWVIDNEHNVLRVNKTFVRLFILESK